MTKFLPFLLWSSLSVLSFLEIVLRSFVSIKSNWQYTLINSNFSGSVTLAHSRLCYNNRNTSLQINMNCTICKRSLEFGYKECTVCDSYKLCPECSTNNGHPHEMRFIQLSQLSLLKNYVRVLLETYRSKEGNHGASAESLQAHMMSTRLNCDCLFCKQIFILYKYHSKKCCMPGCRISRCPVINEDFLKQRLAECNFQGIEQNLLKARLTQVPPTKSIPFKTVLTKKFMIQRCIRTLVHACHCLEPECMPLSCQKMKRILAHIKVCKRKIQGGCIICTQLSTLCCFHAKNCTETKCPVLLCSAYKRKLGVLNKKSLVS